MFRKSLSTNILLLKIVGAWPYNDFNKLASFAYLSFTICFFLVPVSCFPLLYIYLNETKDLIQISQTAFMSCELTLIMPKLVALLLDHRKLRTAVSYWDEQNVYLMMPPGTEEIIIKTARYAKITCKWFTWLCVMGATTWATKPFQDLSKRKLPTDLWLPFDPFKNDFRYALTYLHSYAGCLLCAISNASMDTMLVGLLLHAAAQIKILKEALKTLGIPKQQNLKNCVEHYSDIVEFVKLVESVFTFAVFIQFLGSTVVICFSSFMMTVVPFSSLEFVALVVYILCIVGELFLLCYFGTVLYEESSTITEAIYLGDWEECDNSTKKGLLIFMERTKRPLKLYAGNVVEISLLTFSTILQKAYSLFALLTNLK